MNFLNTSEEHDWKTLRICGPPSNSSHHSKLHTSSVTALEQQKLETQTGCLPTFSDGNCTGTELKQSHLEVQYWYKYEQSIIQPNQVTKLCHICPASREQAPNGSTASLEATLCGSCIWHTLGLEPKVTQVHRALARNHGAKCSLHCK